MSARPARPALAQPIRDSHDGLSASAPPCVKKVTQVLPKTSFPKNPFNGQTFQVEFELPNTLGKVVDTVIQFDMTFSTTDTAGGSFAINPTTLWCDRVLSVLGSSELETVDSDVAHLGTLAFISNQEYEQVAKAVGASTDGNLMSFNVTAAAPVTRTFYLPLWANALESIQPYCKGFRENWRYRLWLTPRIGTYSGTTSVTVACNNMTSWVTEANLSDEADTNLRYAHKAGIVYRAVVQNKWSVQESSISAAGEYRKPMTSLYGDSAGLMAYVRPNSVDPADQLTKAPMQYVALLDPAGREITQRLPQELTRNFVQPDTLPLNKYINTATNPFTIIPLCSNLQEVLELGNLLGGLRMTGAEQIVFLPTVALSNVVVTVIQFGYASLTVSRGHGTFERQGQPNLSA